MNTAARPFQTPLRAARLVRAAVMALAVLAFAVLALSLGGAASQALAQSDGPKPRFPILVIDLNRVHKDSAIGRSVRAQVDAYGKKIRERYAEERARLRDEDSELLRLKRTLSRDAWEKRVAEFRARDAAFKRRQAADSARINEFLASALEIIGKRIEPILQKLMQERGAPVILHRHSVVATANALDVTDDVIKLLDAENLNIRLDIGG